MGRIAERLRRLENAIDGDDDAMRWCRRWKKRYGSKADGRDFLPYGCPDDDPVWLAYMESPQGKADAAAAERHELRGRHIFKDWLTADKMQAIIKAKVGRRFVAVLFARCGLTTSIGSMIEGS